MRTTSKRVCTVVGIVLGAMPAVAGEAGADVTFARDVAPILQRSCQGCHRAGSLAPMAFTTYEETRPWARAMKDKTALREMPPWFVEKNIGVQQFKDDISLSDEEIATFAAWADAGAPRGNPADMPPALEWADYDVWTIGEPDLIVSSPKMLVDALGADFHDELGPIPTGLTEDRYIKAVEVKEVRLLTDTQKEELRKQPTILDVSRGSFVIGCLPPSAFRRTCLSVSRTIPLAVFSNIRLRNRSRTAITSPNCERSERSGCGPKGENVLGRTGAGYRCRPV